MDKTALPLWLHLAESQLTWGNSVLVDSVFMGVDKERTQHRWSDRQGAFKIARRHQVQFRPIYLSISDETIWRERLAERARQFPDAPAATWTQVEKQRQFFQPWLPGQALFLDSLHPVAQNVAAAQSYIENPGIRLEGWI